MAKKFVRSITGIKNIQDQDLSTNNVGDLLSDGKDIYVHRKNGNKEEYFNLTEEKKNPTDIKTPEGKGLTSWKDGNATNVTLSEEFLTNNAQYITSSDNSIVATQTQSKYGKNYDLKLSKELQDTIKNNTGKGGKKIKVEQAPTPISADEPVDVLTVKETDDTITLGLTNDVLTMANFRGDTTTLGGEYISLNEVEWDDLDETGVFDVRRHGWGLHLNEHYWASRRNMKTTKGSGIILQGETELAGLKLDNPDIIFDIDSTKLVRHDCLLGDEAKGIKVWHTDGQSTSAISLTDDVWSKLAKVDQLTSGEPVTPTTVTNTDGNLTVTTTSNNAEVNFSDNAKTKLAKIDTLETDVTNLKNTVVKPKVSISSPKGTIVVTDKENGYNLEVADSALKYVGDGDTIIIDRDLDNNNVISLNSGMKTKINKIDGMDSRLTNLEKNNPSIGAGAQKTIISSDGTVNVTTDENNVDLSVSLNNVNTYVDNKINNEMVAELDKVKTLIEGTTVEAPLTKSYNQTVNGRTVNIALSESAKIKLEEPLFKTSSVDGIRYTVVGIPYSTYNYLATVTIETAPIASSSPVTLARSNEFNKYLSAMSFPTKGGYQSGTIILNKQSSGAINITTANDATATKCQGQFTVIISRM